MQRSLKRRRRRTRRYLPRRKFRIHWGMVVAAAAVAATLLVAALIDGRRGRREIQGLVDYARSGQRSPIDLIVEAGRRHRVVFLGDVNAAAAPKRIAAAAIEALAHGPGLDAVVLEIDSELQPYIERYLNSDPEDVAVLYAQPRALQEQWGVWREYLEIYRRVWRLNQTLGPGRRIRVLAADLPGWPPVDVLSPRTAAALYAQRDAYMAERIESELLAANPRARVLVFMGGYHGLKGGDAELRLTGGEPVPVTWLARRLSERHPGEVFSIVVDGGGRSTATGPIGAYSSTRVSDLIRRHLPDTTGSFALTVNERFDFLREPIQAVGLPGIHLILRPDGYRLQDVVDGYIFLGGSEVFGVRR